MKRIITAKRSCVLGVFSNVKNMNGDFKPHLNAMKLTLATLGSRVVVSVVSSPL